MYNASFYPRNTALTTPTLRLGNSRDTTIHIQRRFSIPSFGGGQYISSRYLGIATCLLFLQEQQEQREEIVSNSPSQIMLPKLKLTVQGSGSTSLLAKGQRRRFDEPVSPQRSKRRKVQRPLQPVSGNAEMGKLIRELHDCF